MSLKEKYIAILLFMVAPSVQPLHAALVSIEFLDFIEKTQHKKQGTKQSKSIKSIKAHLKRGSSLCAQGKFGEGIKEYIVAEKVARKAKLEKQKLMSPWVPMITYFLTEAYLALEMYQKAHNYAKKAIIQIPKLGDGYDKQIGDSYKYFAIACEQLEDQVLREKNVPRYSITEYTCKISTYYKKSLEYYKSFGEIMSEEQKKLKKGVQAKKQLQYYKTNARFPKKDQLQSIANTQLQLASFLGKKRMYTQSSEWQRKTIELLKDDKRILPEKIEAHGGLAFSIINEAFKGKKEGKIDEKTLDNSLKEGVEYYEKAMLLSEKNQRYDFVNKYLNNILNLYTNHIEIDDKLSELLEKGGIAYMREAEKKKKMEEKESLYKKGYERFNSSIHATKSSLPLKKLYRCHLALKMAKNLEDDEKQAIVLTEMAAICQALNRTKDAEKYIFQGLELYGSIAERDEEEAIKYYSTKLEIYKSYYPLKVDIIIETQFERGRWYINHQEYGKAIEDFTQIHRIAEENEQKVWQFKANYRLGKLFAIEDNHLQAVIHYNKAVALSKDEDVKNDPSFNEILSHLLLCQAISCSKCGANEKTTEAIQEYKKVVQKNEGQKEEFPGVADELLEKNEVDSPPDDDTYDWEVTSVEPVEKAIERSEQHQATHLAT